MARYELRHSVDPDGIRFALRRAGAFGFGARDVEFSGWVPNQHAGCDLLRLLVANDSATAGPDGVVVPHETVASMPPSDIAALGLPRPCPFALRLSAQGALSDWQFRIDHAWIDQDGVEMVGFERVGALLRSATAAYTLLNPRQMLLDDVDQLNAAQDGDGGHGLLDARMVRMARVKRTLAEATGDAYAGEYLKKLTIHHATGVGIDAAGPPHDEQFEPVLYGDLPSAAPDPEGERLNEEQPVERGRLLPSQHAQKFRSTLFRNQGARSHYRLADGVYAVVEPAVVAALRVVERVNRAPPATRAEFRANPEAFLTEEIEKAGGTGDVLCGGTAFEAGREYGERVLGVDEWTGKRLSFKTEVYRRWIPDEEVDLYTLAVPGSEKPLVIRPDEVSALRDVVEEAQGAEAPTATFNGIEFPVSADFADTVRDLTGLLAPAPADEGKPSAPSPRRLLVLRVADNEEDLRYNAGLRDPEGRLAGSADLALRTALQPHQAEGLRWLKSAYLAGMPGVLLADDMGLGKTFQVLAFLAWLRANPGPKGHPILIVAPAKLLEEWLEQIGTHIGGTGIGRPVLAYEEHLKALRISRAHEGTVGSHTLDLDRLREADWVLTTYETLRDYHFSFAKIRFRVAVFDEAQKVKSMVSRMTNAAKGQQPDFAVLMTGTPVENELTDLWVLLDIAWPGFLGQSAKEFVRTHRDDVAVAARADLKSRLIEPREIGGRPCPPIMLRRFKADILTGLPRRREAPTSETMPDVQARKYDAVLATARAQRWRSVKTLGALRTVSLHPDLDRTVGAGNHADLIEMSARFKAAFRILDQIRAAGERALVFVDLIRAQHMIQELIQRRYGLARVPALINGETKAAHTKRIKAEFQAGKGFDVLVLGPKAAGFGLTLTAANHVIHLSRWWNPAVEDQCSDRVYRMGQDKDVTIHVPRAIHPRLGDASFDMVLDGLLGSKRALSREIVVPTLMDAGDFEALYNRVAAGGSSDLALLRQLDEAGWEYFEDWVAGQLKEAGFQPHRTPRSGDGGADLVARPPSGSGHSAIICQCKHRSDGEKGMVDETAVDDLQRALPRYKQAYRWLGNPVLVAVTNGRFDLRAVSLADEVGVKLIGRSRIGACAAELSASAAQARDGP